MNFRQLKKFMCNNVNFKCISTYPLVKPRELYCCFPKNPKTFKTSLTIVPKERGPKISAEFYHDAEQQAKISKRIISLQNTQLYERPRSKVLTVRLQNLMQVGQPSLRNFSSKQITKRHTGKGVNKHHIGSSASSSSTSFIRKSKNLLQKFVLSYGKTAPQRFESTKSSNFMPLTRQYRTEKDIKNTNEKKLNFTAKSRKYSNYHSYDKTGTDFNSKDKNKTSLNIGSTVGNHFIDFRGGKKNPQIKMNLMSVDRPLKEKISLVNNKFDIYARRSTQIKYPAYSTSLHLMDSEKKFSPLDVFNVKKLYFDKQSPVLKLEPKPSNKVRLRRDMVAVETPGDGRSHEYKFIEPFQVKDRLMDIPKMRSARPDVTYAPLHTSKREGHILGISTKDTADADGVYFAPKKSGRMYFA